ncbi:DUF6143 family protein [Alkalihalophilus marmarensis]|uniref:DUF6143 family protein n=1 Tax=Alkalihalophilus marmarensis TaxID=521377 RepID=UPI002DBC176D|nr:DUF6143 family protein [Alkalihalophilus marmarensis]MEC2074105.1 DUF6143 family protein [Alkalihalophilus marmarensis]
MSFDHYDSFNKSVNIPNPLYQSLKGRYYVGQTEILRLQKGKHAWGGLFNPTRSDIDLFVNAFTITNYSSQPIVAEIWVNPKLPGRPSISNLVTPANTARTPLEDPEVKIASADLVKGNPKKGVNAFKRIVPPMSTLASDEDGKYIFPPCGAFVLFLSTLDGGPAEAELAFGWFEKDICE